MAGKERSPNYPALSLEAAVQAIRKVYEKERRTSVATDVVGKALGHPNLSGSALTKIGALRQYGLLENVERGKVRVSDDALTVLLRKADDPEYLKALQQVALTPPLFADLFKDYASASDDALKYHLVKERNFSEEGADKVIKAFRHTLAFAKLTGGSYTPEEELDDLDDPEEQPGKGAGGIRRDPLENGFQAGSGFRKPREESMAYNWLLPGGINAQVAFQGVPTSRAIERLIDYLRLMKDDIPEPLAPAVEKVEGGE